MPELPFRIAGAQCKTCIFSKDTPISPARLKDLIESWGSHGHQICHQYGVGTWSDDGDGDEQVLDGEDVWCRGFYDRIRKLQGDFGADLMEKLKEAGHVIEVPLPEESVIS